MESSTNRPESAPLLKEQAYQRIREMILKEVFAPGTFLSERQLAARLGMSKTPIRAALERLEAEGLVAVSPQQGILVREISMREFLDMFDIRIALESFAVSRLAGRLTEEQMEQFQANLVEQSKGVAERNTALCAHLDTKFHMMISQFLGNGEINHVMFRLRDKLDGVVGRIFRNQRQRLEVSYQEHVAILNAMVRGEGELAATLLTQHLEEGKRLLIS